MKYFGVSLIAAAMLASSTLVAASEPASVNVPSVGHLEKRTSSKCKAGSSKHKKHSSKKHSTSSKSASSSESSSSASANTGESKIASGSKTSGKKPDGWKSKGGLAWPNSNGMKIENFLGKGSISWYYSWKATPGWDDAPTDNLFLPMLWGQNKPGGNVEQFQKSVLNDRNGKYNKNKAVLLMNEVNQKGQANMSPSDGCQLIRENIAPLAKDGWYIIGPSTTSAPDGVEWYKKFMSQCKDQFETFDAVATHYYDISAEKFKQYVENWHKVTGKDIWITEMACQNFNNQNKQCSQSETNSFLKETVEWMEAQDYVMGYAWFGAMQNLQGVAEVNRLSQGNSPTSLFRMYSGM